jgi:thiamine-phosphate pyrophosphorylase
MVLRRPKNKPRASFTGAESGKIFRVLDANLNRAREGLRVLEDTARFFWDDRALFASLRKARHALDTATRAAYPTLVGGRESGKDLGRRMAEGTSRDWPGLVAANFRRVQEALRVLEEYGKVFAPGASVQFKKVRFRMYVDEKKALRISN